VAVLLSKGTFPRTTEEGLALYNDKKKAEKGSEQEIT
jgi:hypothetical protein